MNGYDKLKAVAKQHGVKASDLLVLAPQNDPFNCGSPAQVAHAQWFADVYRDYGNAFGDHVRRVHYRIVSQPIPVLMPNGTPYENTDECWAYITLASKFARTLGFVDVERFQDKRNPDPIVYRADPRDDDRPSIEFDEFDYHLPGIAAELIKPSLDIPGPWVRGYDYSEADQPYLIEVWCEKSTMNDVLDPLCRQYGANLVTSIGFQSISAAVSLIRRAIRTGKPARIFYISDFDPAGDRMPVAVARQIEYWIDRYKLDVDIALEPLVLTREQVDVYALPRIPIKASDKRAAKFEAAHGEGAVELDALEALHPGELHRIVRGAVRPYVDDGLQESSLEQRYQVQIGIRSDWEESTRAIRVGLDQLAASVDAVYDRYRAELADLSARMDAELEPLRKTAVAFAEVIQIAQEVEFEPDLPARVESDLEPPESDAAWMFRSDRDFMTQLAAYRGEVCHA